MPPGFEDRAGILPKIAYRGQGVCDPIRSAPGDPGDVGFWHEADISKYLGNVRYFVNSRKNLLL